VAAAIVRVLPADGNAGRKKRRSGRATFATGAILSYRRHNGRNCGRIKALTTRMTTTATSRRIGASAAVRSSAKNGEINYRWKYSAVCSLARSLARSQARLAV